MEFTKTQVKEVRIELLNVRQPVFARMLGVSDGAVKVWEQGTNTPSGSAARLLQIARNAPETFKEIMVRIANGTNAAYETIRRSPPQS